MAIDVETLINQFGGAKSLATLLNVSTNSVHNWKRDGIPAKHWHVLVDYSKRKRSVQTLTYDDLRSLAAKHFRASGANKEVAQ